MEKTEAQFNDQNSETQKSAKEKHWQEMEEHFRSTSRKEWLPLEEGILETVVALNILGIKTWQSCAGHKDWPFEKGWPVVDLVNEEESIAKAQELIAEFYHDRKVAEYKKLIVERTEYYDDLNDETHIYQKLKSKGSGSIPRKWSIAAIWHWNWFLKKISSRNEEYAQEMRGFTEFLKEKYFES